MLATLINKVLPKDLYVSVRREQPPMGRGEALCVPTKLQLNRYNCGLVAAVTLIETFHPKWKGHERIVAEIDTTDADGTTNAEVLRHLRWNGVGVTKGRGHLTFAKIRKAIGAGYPVLTPGVVLERDDDGTPTLLHWVVIYGYGEGAVYVSNSSLRAFRCAQRIPEADFFSKFDASSPFWVCHGRAGVLG